MNFRKAIIGLSALALSTAGFLAVCNYNAKPTAFLDKGSLSNNFMNDNTLKKFSLNSSITPVNWFYGPHNAFSYALDRAFYQRQQAQTGYSTRDFKDKVYKNSLTLKAKSLKEMNEKSFDPR